MAIKALMKIMAANSHFKQEYGSLVQALSIYTEKFMEGCKSGNERYVYIMSMVDLLRGGNLEVMKALRNFVSQEGTSASLLDFYNTFNNELNRTGLHTFTNISHFDQAGSIKTTASDSSAPESSFILKNTEANTNVIVGCGMDNLQQNHVSFMQAHKGKHKQALVDIYDEMKDGKKVTCGCF